MSQSFSFALEEDHHCMRHCYSSVPTENLQEEAEITGQSNVGGCLKTRVCIDALY